MNESARAPAGHSGQAFRGVGRRARRSAPARRGPRAIATAGAAPAPARSVASTTEPFSPAEVFLRHPRSVSRAPTYMRTRALPADPAVSRVGVLLKAAGTPLALGHRRVRGASPRAHPPVRKRMKPPAAIATGSRGDRTSGPRGHEGADQHPCGGPLGETGETMSKNIAAAPVVRRSRSRLWRARRPRNAVGP